MNKIKKFLVSVVLLSLCSTFIAPSKIDADKISSKNENIDLVVNEIKEIQKGGITEKEVKAFIEFLKEKFGEDSIYVNTMCKVIGIGGGILFPPFLPLSPLLISFPITFLDTQGLQGHWFHAVHLAIFISFVGAPFYIFPPPLFVIGGFAGMVIGIVFD